MPHSFHRKTGTEACVLCQVKSFKAAAALLQGQASFMGYRCLKPLKHFEAQRCRASHGDVD